MMTNSTKDMKAPCIAIISETFRPEVNGVANTLGYWVDGLIARGFQVQVIRPRQSYDDLGSATDTLSEITVAGLPIPKYSELKFGLPAPGLFRRLWKNEQPKAVYVATEGPLGYSAASAARKLGIPVTSGFHTNFQSYSQFYGFGLLERLILSYLRRFHNQTKGTLVPTKTQQYFLEKNGFKNVSVISRGVDCTLYNPQKASTSLRENWGAHKDDPVFIYVGRLAHEKNVRLIAESYKQILSTHPTAKLVFVGDGPARTELEEACPEAIFAGMQRGEELAKHYASADVFLFPSKTDTFGNVVTEAMASGLAVIGFEDAAVKELLTDRVSGYVIPLDRDAEFTSAMQEAFQNKEQLTKIKDHSLALAKSISWDVVVDNFARSLSLPEQTSPSNKSISDTSEEFSYGNA